MEIKSIEQVKEEVAKEHGFRDFAMMYYDEEVEIPISEIATRYAQQFQEQALTDVLTTEIMVLRERNLQIMVDHLRREWEPKTKPSEFEIYHGSQKGEVKSIIKYWDEYKCTWTDKESAFRGYVFNAIKEFIKL